MALSKEQFVDVIKEMRDVISSDENINCSCPNLKCELHGDCYNCVRIYRHFGTHVPRCLQFVLENKIANIKECADNQIMKRSKTSDSYYEYLDSVAPPKKD